MCAVKVNGLDKVIKQLRRLKEDTDKLLMEELKKICDDVLADAVQRAPSEIKASGYVTKVDGGWAVGFSLRIAPYYEFGTGDFVEVPQGQEEFAMEFFVNGLGTTRPQPYLFPAFFAKWYGIIEELERRLNDYFKSK